MAITRALLTADWSDVNATSRSTASISPAANRLITAAVTVYNNAGAAPNISLSGNGLTWVEIDTYTNPSGNQRTSIFRAMGASPSAGAVTISTGATTTAAWAWCIQEWDGVDTSGTNGSGAIVQSNRNRSASSASLTVTLSALADAANNAVTGSFSLYTNASSTPGTGYTEASDLVNASDGMSQSDIYAIPGTTTPNVTFAASSEILGVAIEIKAAGGGPTLISASDTLALGVTDAVGSIAATLAVSDSLDVRVTDTQSLLAALSAADTVAPGVSDSAAIAVVIAASDTLAPGISDAVADMTALVSVADTFSPAIADALGQIAAALAVTDAVDVRITDAQSLLALLATADTLAPALADSATVLVAVSSGDTVTVSIADAAAVDILASTLGRMAALITVRPALAAAVATDPALGGAPGGAPALGGKPKLN